MHSIGATPEASGERLTRSLVLLVFLVAAGFTAWMCVSMSGDMPMPGGWAMSMAWMPMAGQGWAEATTLFLLMWLAMMVAMMLPSALPLLLVYRRWLRFRGDAAVALRLFTLSCGYFLVWLSFGLVAYVLGVVLMQAAMASEHISRAVPWAAALALIAAGGWQFSRLKSACLAHCRDPLGDIVRHREHALRLGLVHGGWCAGCCWGIMLVQLVIGVMSLSAMAALAAWIAVEKLSGWGPALLRPSGVLAIAAGLWMGGRAWLG